MLWIWINSIWRKSDLYLCYSIEDLLNLFCWMCSVIFILTNQMVTSIQLPFGFNRQRMNKRTQNTSLHLKWSSYKVHLNTIINEDPLWDSLNRAPSLVGLNKHVVFISKRFNNFIYRRWHCSLYWRPPPLNLYNMTKATLIKFSLLDYKIKAFFLHLSVRKILIH